MALCQYCGKVEIAWQQVERKYVAFHAQVGPDGAPVKKDVRDGARIVRRNVANTDAPHYPHIHHGTQAGGRTASECEVWTPGLAKARPRYQKRVQPAPRYIPDREWHIAQAPEPPDQAPRQLVGGFDPGVLLPDNAPPMPHIPPGDIVPMPVAQVDYDRLRAETRAEVVKVLDEYGVQPPPQELVVRRPDGAQVNIKGDMHVKVPALITYVARGKHVYLYGAAGGGKTHAACQALGAVCPEVSVLTMPGLTTGKLFGFTDASGVYRDTPFVRAYRDGGGVVLDELDRAMPAVAAALNSVLENRRATFDGREVPMHARFGLIATGNTDMRGGTRTYTGAQPLDLATAARFAFVYWEYDEVLEDKLVAGIIGKGPAKTLLAWGRKLRATLETEKHDTVFAGPREMLRIAEDLAAGVAMGDAVNAWVWRGLEAATVTRLTLRHAIPTVEVRHE